MKGPDGGYATLANVAGGTRAAALLLARQWVHSAADAEDIVQEAFLRFWHSRHTARDPVAYLYACTRSHCLDWLRDRHRRVRREEAAARKEQAVAPDLFRPSSATSPSIN